MDQTQDQDIGEAWAAVVGAVLVSAVILLIVLTALGGWAWVADFLRSGAPAWIQAVGSIAAIVAALSVVQRQHSLEVDRKRAEERAEHVRRSRALKVVFFSAAKTCESVAHCIGQKHTYWPLQAAELREVRGRLLSLDPMLLPSSRLLLVIEDCLARLHTCASLAEALATQRPAKVQDAIRGVLLAAAQECWLGMYEATAAESKLVRGETVDAGDVEFGDFRESRRHLDRISAEFSRETQNGVVPPTGPTSEGGGT